MTTFHVSPPPKQNPTTPIVPLVCVFRKSTAALWSEIFSATERLPSAALYVAWSVSFAAPPSRAARSMLSPTKPAVATRRTTSRMCSVCPRFSWMTITPGTRPLRLAFAMYAWRSAPSAPLTDGCDTVMRGSFSLTVTPSVVVAGGGVAQGCATRLGDPEALVGALDGDAAAGFGLRTQEARMVLDRAALPA